MVPSIALFAPLRSLRGRLLLLAIAVVLPALILAGYLVYEAYREERAAVERQLRETSRAMSLVVDRQLGQAEAILKTLSASPALAQGDYRAFHAQAVAALPPYAARLTVVASDNRQLVNTAKPWGTPLPDVVERPDLAAALARGETYITHMLPGAASDRPMILLAIPYADPAAGLRGLGLAMPADVLNAVFADQGIPPEWVAAIIDREGYIAARSRRAEDFVGRPATDNARAHIARADTGFMRSVTLDGVHTLAAFNRSSYSGWTVILGVPEAQVLAPAVRLLATVALAAFALIGFGVVLSLWIGHGIVRSMDALVRDAEAVGRGEMPAQPPPGVTEAQLVATALRRASASLRAREQELLGLNQTLEARVQEASERLVNAGKLEAIGRLTGGIAHDFNNLLAAVRINLDLLLRHSADPHTLRFAQAARESTDRGARLVAQLLAFARKQRLRLEPVSVNGVVEAMADMLRGTLTGTVPVRLELAPGLPPALADRTQLELIIMNLAINARDAMGEGGEITITTAEAVIEHRPRRQEAAEPGRYIVLSVADTGRGMAPEVLERVFEPFFTTKQVGKGSGLGLPQVLGVVKQMEGGVEIVSQPGQGTRIDIYLRAATADALPPPCAAGEPVAADLSGLRVLLVDDDAAVRSAGAALLQDIGCRVTVADGAATALALLRDGLEVDIALLDYAMPGMTGSELAQRIMSLHAGLPVLLMSGYVEAEQLAPFRNGRLLQKPFSKQELAAALAAGAGRKAPPQLL